jgi:hypothetical protein
MALPLHRLAKPGKPKIVKFTIINFKDIEWGERGVKPMYVE